MYQSQDAYDTAEAYVTGRAGGIARVLAPDEVPSAVVLRGERLPNLVTMIMRRRLEVPLQVRGVHP